MLKSIILLLKVIREKRSRKDYLPLYSGAENKQIQLLWKLGRSNNEMLFMFYSTRFPANYVHFPGFPLCMNQSRRDLHLFKKVVEIKLSYQAENHNQNSYDLSTQENNFLFHSFQVHFQSWNCCPNLTSQLNVRFRRLTGSCVAPCILPQGHSISQSASSL